MNGAAPAAPAILVRGNLDGMRDARGRFAPGASGNPGRRFKPGHDGRRTGGWKPGQSGNPGGLTAATREIRQILKAPSPEGMERLAAWMRSDDPGASVAACKAILKLARGTAAAPPPPRAPRPPEGARRPAWGRGRTAW